MTTATKRQMFRGRFLTLCSVILLVAGIGAHLFLFKEQQLDYVREIGVLVGFLHQYLQSVPSLATEMAEAIYKYLGVFFIPLGWCLFVAIRTRLKFWQARVNHSPIPLNLCRQEWDRIEYIAITRASQWGMLGTLIYIIVGLGLMAEPMITIAEKLQSQEPILEVLPAIFITMGNAVMKIIPALGTTVGALITEMLASPIQRTCQEWYGQDWQNSSLGSTVISVEDAP